MSDTIRERDLGAVAPSPTDEVRLLRGGRSVRGSVLDLPTPAATQQQLDMIQLAMASGMVPYETAGDLPVEPADTAQLAWVWGDPTPENNGAWAWNTGTETWARSEDTTTALQARMTTTEQTLDPIAAKVDPFGSMAGDYLFAIADALNRIGLGLRPDGTLDTRVRSLPIVGGGVIDGDFANVEGDLFVLADADGKVALRVRADGTLIAKTEVDLAEVAEARGTRDTLDERLSQSLNPYGLPRRHLWGEWFLRETRQRLRKLALAEATQLVVASIGDSWTHNANRWSRPTARTLIAEYGSAGSGWVGFANNGGSLPNDNIDSVIVTVARSGTWDYTAYSTSIGPDIGQATSSTAASKMTVAAPANVSAVRLFYIGTTGQLRYRFDGGSWTTLNTTGSGLLVENLAGVPATAFSLEIEVVSGTVSLCGVDLQATGSGVRWHKLGSTGSRASHWAAVNAASWKGGLTELAPHLVTILLATNDQAAYNAATFRGYVQTLITRVREALPLADILLVAPCENGRANTWPMPDYAEALYELAAQNRCAFVDLQYVFGDEFSEYASTSPRAWFNADLIHPEPTTGGRAIADVVLRLLTHL